MNYIFPVHLVHTKLVCVAATVVKFKFPVEAGVAVYMLAVILPISVGIVVVIYCQYTRYHKGSRHRDRYGITSSLDNQYLVNSLTFQ